MLVVANEALAGAELAELILEDSREHVEVDVLAPVLASHLHYVVSDIDGELAEARTRLERSLAWAREHKIVARGEVGDPNPTTALEDELRTFGADAVIIVTHRTTAKRGKSAASSRACGASSTFRHHVVAGRGREEAGQRRGRGGRSARGGAGDARRTRRPNAGQ